MLPASRRGSPASSPRRLNLPFEDLATTLPRDAARRRLAAAFREAAIEQPDLDARVLLCAALGIDHADLTRNPDAAIGPGAATLADFARRRLSREPVARILGRREFWGLSFAIGPEVLDPRPETEGLVGSLLDAVGGRRDAPLDLLDLGTGSGAILAALLSELPGARGVGVDASPAACRVARLNLSALGFASRAALVCGVWADALAGRFDLVACNPPYIPSADVAGLAQDVRGYDPVSALDGGDDGLDAYRAIVPRLKALLRPGGVAAFECGYDQSERVAASMRTAGLDGVMIYKDLAGHGRVVLGATP